MRSRTNPQTLDRLRYIAGRLANGDSQSEIARSLNISHGAIGNFLERHAAELRGRSKDQAQAARDWLKDDAFFRKEQARKPIKNPTKGCSYYVPGHGVCGAKVHRAGYCKTCFPKTAPVGGLLNRRADSLGVG